MSNKLFVGSLPYEVSDDELENIFKEFGQVLSAKVIVDKFSGRSKGFGFVEMENNSSAQNAIDTLNGSELKGRTINVNFAREKTEGGGGSGRRYGNNSGGGGKKRYDY